MYPAIFFILGVVVLLVSADVFVQAASQLSKKVGLSPLVIGITIVALGTSLPELVVSMLSAFKGDSGLAFGNIIGSNAVNILLVFPLGILCSDLRIGTMKTQRNTLILLLVSVVFYLVSRMFSAPWIGYFLIGCAILFTIEEYRWGRSGITHEDKARFSKLHTKEKTATIIAKTVGSLVGIGIGGYITVISTENISLATGISTTFLGFTITAIGTSLPELFTTLFSARHNEEKITMGNILGSNIYNVLLIGGLTTLIANPYPMNTYHWIIFLFSSILLVGIVVFYRGRIIPKWVGVFLLVLFLGSGYFISKI
jgi:cation:H+ antiporter